MHSSPETTQLVNIFHTLDKDKKGYIVLDTFRAYINHQPRKLQQYEINHLFSLLPDGKMSEQAFIIYMMGYRMKMEQFALTRFSIQKQLLKHASASPSSAVNEIKKSSIKLNVASKKNLAVGEKHRFSIEFGKDEKTQSARYQQFAQVMGRKAEQTVALIKFKVAAAHQQIRQGLQTVIETAKGMLAEMDQQLFRVLDLFKFTVKCHGNYIYIFAEISHVFFDDMVKFINQMIQTLSPQALFKFRAQIQSNYLKDILKDGGEKKMEDLQVQFNLDFDQQSMKKLKTIAGNQIEFFNEKQKLVSTLLLLFQQVNLQAQFSNSQKLFSQFGLGSIISQSKQQLNAIKDMSILQTLQGFIPDSGELISNLKKYAKGEGQISVNLRNIYFKVDFNIQIQGILDLL